MDVWTKDFGQTGSTRCTVVIIVTWCILYSCKNGATLHDRRPSFSVVEPLQLLPGGSWGGLFENEAALGQDNAAWFVENTFFT